NRMTARRAWTASGQFERGAEGQPWQPSGGAGLAAGQGRPASSPGEGSGPGRRPPARPGPGSRPARSPDSPAGPGGPAGEAAAAELRLLLEAAALCNNAAPASSADDPAGDPTEVGLVKAAWAAGIDAYQLQRERPRLVEHPFSSERRRMSVVCDAGG